MGHQINRLIILSIVTAINGEWYPATLNGSRTSPLPETRHTLPNNYSQHFEDQFKPSTVQMVPNWNGSRASPLPEKRHTLPNNYSQHFEDQFKPSTVQMVPNWNGSRASPLPEKRHTLPNNYSQHFEDQFKPSTVQMVPNWNGSRTSPLPETRHTLPNNYSQHFEDQFKPSTVQMVPNWNGSRASPLPEKRHTLPNNYSQHFEDQFKPSTVQMVPNWNGSRASPLPEKGHTLPNNYSQHFEDQFKPSAVRMVPNWKGMTKVNPTAGPHNNRKGGVLAQNQYPKTIKPRRKLLRTQHNNFLNNDSTGKRTVVRKLEKQMNAGKLERFLEMFEVVEFGHVDCVSSSGLDGTCLHEYDCANNGGLAMGSCADGYAVCCVVQFSCDDIMQTPKGWFVNPGFPDPSQERLTCALTVNKSSEGVKQIRLDFMSFELLPPTAGTCVQDKFVVSGQNVNSIMPILCGINNGLHAYIEVGNVDGPITLSIQTATVEHRLFAIKISQLSTGDDLSAPAGCLQYFQYPTGYLESFNYRDTSDVPIAKVPGYLNNLNYAMCIERESESCSITYTNAGIMQIPNYDAVGLPVMPPGQAGVEIFNCPSDWLLIAAARLCGDRLNDGSVLQDFSFDAPVTDNGAGPIVLWFRSDEGYVGRGFRLQFKQNSCSL